MSAGHWATRAEIGAAWGMRFTFWVHRWLGRWPFRLVLLPVIAYFFARGKDQRAASLQYFSHMHQSGAISARPGLLAVWRHFWAYGEGLLDRLAAWDPQAQAPMAQFHGEDTVLPMLEQKKGFLLFSAHLGNLEAARVLGRALRKTTIHVLVHTKHAGRYMALMRDLNPDSQLNLVQVADIGPHSALWLKERIEEGHVVLIAADRVPLEGGLTVEADFFGAKALFPAGPYVLASVLECPVVLFFCLGGAGHYHVHYELFAEALRLPRAGRADALRGLAERFSKRLEQYCKMAPLQWGNFYPFWRGPNGVSKEGQDP